MNKCVAFGQLVFYTLVMVFLAIPYLFLRFLFLPSYRKDFFQRLGRVDVPNRARGALLIHAVSVGETIAAFPLVSQLRAQKPDLEIVFTTTTLTGRQTARRLLGNTVHHHFFPLDIPWIVNRFLRVLKPRQVVLVETELWPHWIHLSCRWNVPVLMVNARLSQKSAKRYAFFSALTAQTLRKVKAVAAQDKDSGARFIHLGLPAEALHITGSAKFDVTVSAEEREQARIWRKRFGQRPVWLAASTHEGEEKAVLKAAEELWREYPQLLLVVAPRHPVRFLDVFSHLRKSKKPVARYSRGDFSGQDVFLIDEMGRLPAMFGASDVSFIGGSLVPVGGHNMMEAAVWGVPLIVGPHLFNFEDMASQFRREGALCEVRGHHALAEAVRKYFSQADVRARAGAAVRRVAERGRGASARQREVIETYL